MNNFPFGAAYVVIKNLRESRQKKDKDGFPEWMSVVIGLLAGLSLLALGYLIAELLL